jgi:hypothetical protein
MYEFSKMKRVFRDPELQDKFEKDGYVIVDFYSPEEVQTATDLYYKIHPKDEKGFFPATYSMDKNFRGEMDLGLKQVGSRSIESYLTDIKVICASYIVKTPGPDSGMSIHQDMTLVDESRFTGINIWIPLVDLTVENGTLFVLPGSHRIFPTYRGSSITEFFGDVMSEMIDYMHPVFIKAGQAVIFDQSIIHYSPPNYSDSIRIVTNTYFTYKDAEFRTYFWDPSMEDKYVEGFAQDDNFMLDYEQFGANINQRPKVGKSLGLIPYNFPKIDSAMLASRFEKTNARELVEKAKPKQAVTEPAVAEIPASSPLQPAPKKTIFQRLKELVS